MSQKNRTQRMMRIWQKRGRTPIRSTHVVIYAENERKSQAGVKYVVYTPMLAKYQDYENTKTSEVKL